MYFDFLALSLKHCVTAPVSVGHKFLKQNNYFHILEVLNLVSNLVLQYRSASICTHVPVCLWFIVNEL